MNTIRNIDISIVIPARATLLDTLHRAIDARSVTDAQAPATRLADQPTL